MSPFKSARPCPGRGKRYHSCPNLIRGLERYCPDCQAVADKESAKYDRERDQTEERRFIHSTHWRAIRDAKLSRDPLCERCAKPGYKLGAEEVPHDTPATMVHHIDGNELNNVDENLESLCNPCHEEKEKSGRWGR